jgi:hypothetical protein
MEINKTYLQERKEILLKDLERINKEIEERIIILHRLEGGIETINLIIKDSEKEIQ